MNAAEMFVLNTGYEGFSHVLLEAMMLGTPILTTAVCGNPELVLSEQNGVLVHPNHEEELLDQLERLISDRPLRERLSRAGKETAKRFAWETLLDETVMLLMKAT
jgi:glycosyltransferase involved in cell wall biosynthesis